MVCVVLCTGRLNRQWFWFKAPQLKVRKAAMTRNRYNQVPHLTEDITWESDKNTIKHRKQEPRGQPFPSR